MQQFLGMMAIFIQYPWIAALVGVSLLALGRWRRPGATVAGVVWLLYAAYETGMKQRWLCTGECNIRVDLLLVYPLLLGVTVVGVVSLFRAKAGQR